MNFRHALAFGTVAAALSAGVAASRAPHSAAAFFVLLGGAALLFGPVLGALSAARPVPFALRAVLLGLGLAALPLSKLAGTLKAVTHHRPLGAVTFAALALVLCLGAIVVSARLLAASVHSTRTRGLRVGVVLLALAGPVLLLTRAAASASLRGGVFDVAFGLGSGALLGLLPWPAAALRAAELSAFPLWFGAVLTGIASGLVLGGGPAALASPALAAPITWMLQ